MARSFQIWTFGMGLAINELLETSTNQKDVIWRFVMNLVNVLSTNRKNEAVDYLKNNPDEIPHAIDFAITNDSKIGWRAAWILNFVLEKNDQRIQRHLDNLIETLPTKPAGHQRELLKIIALMELSDKQESAVYFACLSIWESTRSIPSVRHFSFRFMYQMTKKYPELSHEVLSFCQPQFLHSLSPGIRNAVSKMITKLEQLAVENPISNF